MTPTELIDALVYERQLATVFPASALAEAERFAKSPPGAGGERRDIRHLPLATLDGADARDFDDAVWGEDLGGGRTRIVVAIADVGAHVPAGSALDREARRRGTSVYLPDRVVPMLPEALSNDACSLRADEDRLCVGAEMVSENGETASYRMFRGVMRSRRRMTYDEADAEARFGGEGKSGGGKISAELRKSLLALGAAADAMRENRRQRGGMLLERPEKTAQVRDGRVYAAEFSRNAAHWLIEECMIAANRCAADFLIRHRRAALHRAHPRPDDESVAKLAIALREAGLPPLPRRPRAADFAKPLAAAERKDPRLADALISTVLGAIGRAEYTPNFKTGHFGLACKRYLHFTSPIRRYPDLIAHRVLTSVLSGEKPRAAPSDLAEVGRHCSETETAADKMGWNCRQRLLCWAARERLGDEFEGYVSGAAQFGIFIYAPAAGLDGMLRLSSLPGYWKKEPNRPRFSSAQSGRSLGLGDRVRVQLAAADPQTGKADFAPAEGEF